MYSVVQEKGRKEGGMCILSALNTPTIQLHLFVGERELTCLISCNVRGSPWCF